MVEIPLTQGYSAIVDDEDAEAVLAHTWYAAQVKPGQFYAARRVAGHARRPLQYLHTFLTGYIRTDHINEDRLDNRRENLREVTVSQNAWNRGPQANNTSGYKGVYLRKGDGRWLAEIRANRVRHSLGSHATALGAALAYDEAALRLHGEYARLNFPGADRQGRP